MNIVPCHEAPRSLSDIDRDFAESHRVLRCQEMSVAFERRDAELFASHSRVCPRCGERLLSKGLSEPLAFVCLAGRFAARIHRLCCAVCDATVYPIDAELDRATRVLPSAAEHLVRFAVQAGGYEKGSAEAAFHLGVSVSSSTLHRLVAHEAAYVEDGLAAETELMLETGVCPEERVALKDSDTLYLAVDGGHVAGRDKKSFEVKAAVAWTGVAEVSEGRRRLTGREGYASVEGVKSFFPKVAALAIRNGMLTAGRVVVLADGADWIRNGVRDWLPGALYVLDWTHLERRVRGVLCRPEDAELAQAVLDACRRAEPAEALVLLMGHKPSPEPEVRHLYRRLVRYVRINASGIANHALVDVHGSGAIEKGVDLMISRRFKLRGMSWSEKGAAALLPFKVMLYNDNWSTHWDRRVESLPSAA
ncbi:MAG: UPF0236 family protein [Coriobacteriia bacterium]|nr:UPF0236 family protein [Coriobacteriia bacterium]